MVDPSSMKKAESRREARKPGQQKAQTLKKMTNRQEELAATETSESGLFYNHAVFTICPDQHFCDA